MFAFYEHHNRKEQIRRIEIANFSFPSHLHQETEIVHITKGTCLLTIEKEKHLLTTGMIALIFPHCVHSYHSNYDYQAEIFIIDTPFLSEYELLLTTYLPEMPIIKESTLIQKFLKEVDDNFTVHDFRELALQRALWYMIFALSIQTMTFKKRQSNNLTLVHQILSYIDEHYRAPITTQEIAQNIGCSVFTISKIFSQKIGMSFPEYLAHLRISYAKQLIETTTYSILDIALKAGFENQRSFNRHFLKQTGQTPSDYRQSYRLDKKESLYKANKPLKLD